MARPKKHEMEKRNRVIAFRATVAEEEHLREQAANVGLSLSDYTRRRSVGHVVAAPARPKFDPALVSEVNRIGVNVNQLTQAVHMDREFVKYWREIGKELEALLEKLVDSDDS